MAYNLKSAEEVSEYLKNLHIEYQFGCSSEKNPEACHLLGDYEESIVRDFSKAAATYKANCDELNYPKSCGKFGGYVATGRGLESENFEEGYRYMKKGCELGDPMACTNAGIAATSKRTDSENTEPIDFKLGLEMLEKGCTTYKLEKACTFLAELYLKGFPGHLERNMTEAYKVSLKACDLHNMYACFNVSQMYTLGKGVDKDPELAQLFKKRARALEQEMNQNRTIKFQQGID